MTDFCGLIQFYWLFYFFVSLFLLYVFCFYLLLIFISFFPFLTLPLLYPLNKVLRCLATCYTSFTFLDFCCDHCPNFFFALSVLVFISINHVSVTKIESPLDTDTQIISTLWHVPLVSELTGFYCN